MLKDFNAQKSLAETVAFQSLNALERQRLYQFCQLKKIKAKQILQTNDFVYFLLSGCLKIDHQKILPVSFVGLEGLFVQPHQVLKIQASIRSVVIQIPCQIIKELMRSNAKLSQNLGVMLQLMQSEKKSAQIIAVTQSHLALQLALSMRRQFKKEVLLIDLNSQAVTIAELLNEGRPYQYLIIRLSKQAKDKATNQMILHYAQVLVSVQKIKGFENRFFKYAKLYQTPPGIDRLARQIAHKTIGVALSSGLASSLYHVGVMKALRHAGMPIDAIAGCSGGALMGSLFTNGKKFSEIDHFVKQMVQKPFYKHFNVKLNPTQFLSFEPILHSLKKFLGDKKLTETDTPFQIVATDLKAKKKYIFKKGDMYQAIGASFSMPFVGSVYAVNNKALVDGYLTEPVPTPTLREAGIDFVLAVDVTDDGANGEIKHFMDLYFHTRRTLTSNLRQAALKQSDLLLQPQFKKYKPMDYSLYPQYLKMGERAAKKMIPKIKKFLQA